MTFSYNFFTELLINVSNLRYRKNGFLLVEKMHGSRSALLPVFFRLLAIEMSERIPPLCRFVGTCTIIGKKKAHGTGINFPLNLKVCWN